MNKVLILVVEDDTSVRNLLTTTLKAHDYRYIVAPGGQEAILEASSHNPDIILLDLGLPDIGGIEVIEKISTLYKYVKENEIDIDIEADGGINLETAGKAKKAGANILVAGTSIVQSDNYTETVNRLKKDC